MKISPVEVAFSPCEQSDGRTDRRDEAKGRFSQFCGSAYKPTLKPCCYEPYRLHVPPAMTRNICLSSRSLF